MKKAVAILMVFCLMAGWAGAVLVDDFESYAPGAIGAADPVWKMFGCTLTIAADPADPGNKVLDFLETQNSNGAYGIFSGDAVLGNGQTKTLFFRMRQSGSFNSVVGMTNVLPVSNNWTTIGPRLRMGGGNPTNTDSLMATTGATWGDPAQNLTPTTPAGTWYNVWIQANHATNTFKVYKNAVEGADAVLADRVGILPSSAFCNAAAADMNYFQIISWGTAHIYFDDIHVLDGESFINPTVTVKAAHEPNPAKGATNVPTTTTTVSWLTGLDSAEVSPNPEITKHYVYMREGDPNLKYVTPVPVEAGDPVEAGASCAIASFTSPAITLTQDKTYYWRVDEGVNDSLPADSNTIKGQAWSFETVKSVPTITTHPASVRVSTPNTASFTTVFVSVTTPTATWYKNGVLMAGAGTLTNVGTTYTATLTFATTSDTDQADYQCRLTVSGKESTPTLSNMVNLVTKKLLAHYGFEDNLNDSSSYGPHNGTGKSVADPNVTATMTYDTGKVGSKAVVFDGAAFVDLGVDAYPRGSFTGTTLIGTGVGLGAGMDEATICCWVKVASLAGLNTGLLCNYNDNIPATTEPDQPFVYGAGFGMQLSLGNADTTSDSRAHLRGELPGPPIVATDVGAVQGTFTRDPAFNMAGDGKWHQVAVTWKQGDKLVAYIDGVQVATSTAAAGTRDIFYAPQRGPVIGGIRNEENRILVDQLYHGLMDDLRVYNYAMSNFEVADVYYATGGDGACIATGDYAYAAKYDYDYNCIVDLADFMFLASEWLDCGKYPVSSCN